MKSVGAATKLSVFLRLVNLVNIGVETRFLSFSIERPRRSGVFLCRPMSPSGRKQPLKSAKAGGVERPVLGKTDMWPGKRWDSSSSSAHCLGQYFCAQGLLGRPVVTAQVPSVKDYDKVLFGNDCEALTTETKSGNNPWVASFIAG